MKAMSFFYSRKNVELEVDATPWTKVEYITDIGEDQPSDEAKETRIYFENGERCEPY